MEGDRRLMNAENISSVGATIGGGFLAGILIGYALKKVVKLIAIVLGLYFAGLTYLQYQQILNINWNKLQIVSQNTLSTLANAATQIPGFNTGNHVDALPMTNFGIPLTQVKSQSSYFHITK
jgi:uncharacterized membrane protein (Fun14 family)